MAARSFGSCVIEGAVTWVYTQPATPLHLLAVAPTAQHQSLISTSTDERVWQGACSWPKAHRTAGLALRMWLQAELQLLGDRWRSTSCVRHAVQLHAAGDEPHSQQWRAAMHVTALRVCGARRCEPAKSLTRGASRDISDTRSTRTMG
jgi:hypothetical protein